MRRIKSGETVLLNCSIPMEIVGTGQKAPLSRLRLLLSVRRVYVQLISAYPMQALFRLCHRRLKALRPASG